MKKIIIPIVIVVIIAIIAIIGIIVSNKVRDKQNDLDMPEPLKKDAYIFSPSNKTTSRTDTNKKYKSVSEKGKYGLVDNKGEIVINFISDKEILFSERLELVIINLKGLDYLAKLSGEIISDGYEDLAFPDDVGHLSYERDYYSDYIIVSTFKKEDKNKKERIEIAASSNRWWNREKFGLLDKNGQLVVPVLNTSITDIFPEAKFCVISEDHGPLIITDYNGQQIGKNEYSDIMRVADGYYIAQLADINTGENDVVINANGEEISKYYQALSLINSKLMLFKCGPPGIWNYKIIDKNDKVRIEKATIDLESRESEQPYLNCGDSFPASIIVDGVEITVSAGKLKLLKITDNEITLQHEDWHDKTKINTITIRDGKIVEK